MELLKLFKLIKLNQVICVLDSETTEKVYQGKLADMKAFQWRDRKVLKMETYNNELVIDTVIENKA